MGCISITCTSIHPHTHVAKTSGILSSLSRSFVPLPVLYSSHHPLPVRVTLTRLRRVSSTFFQQLKMEKNAKYFLFKTAQCLCQVFLPLFCDVILFISDHTMCLSQLNIIMIHIPCYASQFCQTKTVGQLETSYKPKAHLVVMDWAII